MENDIWASVRVGNEPVGDYLAFAQGLQSDRSRAVLQDLFGGLDYIDKHLVGQQDQEQYQAWLRQFLAPMMKDVGWEPKAGESDERKTLRPRVVEIMGYDARDPEVLAQARKIADQALANSPSVEHDMLPAVLADAAVNGGSDFYDAVVSALKQAKSPEEYYNYFFALAQFGNPKLLQRRLILRFLPTCARKTRFSWCPRCFRILPERLWRGISSGSTGRNWRKWVAHLPAAK